MTPTQITAIDVRELKELEIRCECGSAIHVPVPPRKPLPEQQPCVSCGRYMWEDQTVRDRIEAILESLSDWSGAGYQTLTLRFVLQHKS